MLNPKTALYLLLRRGGSLVAITFAPYPADAKTKSLLLDNRDALVQKLGKEHFASSIICKEIGEIIDARSWDERSGNGQSWNSDHGHQGDACEMSSTDENGVQDLGHKKNKCRLCDRRMKNQIDEDALAALKSITKDGDFVQFVRTSSHLSQTTKSFLLTRTQSVNITTECLQLNLHTTALAPSDVASHLPTSTPSFTFYRHTSNHSLYFIFCSPDSATVKERMKHTMAIPGLVNIIAQDNGVDVDQKIEIHDPEDLDFQPKDERIGKFRSMYLRNEAVGTESRWDGMEQQQKILDAVR